MSVVHLPQSPLPMLKLVPPLSLGREDVLWGCEVWCPQTGCRWHARAWDATDAIAKLEVHYGVHDAERAEMARRVDLGGVPA